MLQTNSGDYTKEGTKIEGTWENDRNASNRDLFKSIIQEVFGDGKQLDVIIAHHLVYAKQEDDYFVVEEIPSADTLIFDHEIARKLFGNDFTKQLVQLACVPAENRDDLLSKLLSEREVH
jgi:hypothetical protein